MYLVWDMSNFGLVIGDWWNKDVWATCSFIRAMKQIARFLLLVTIGFSFCGICWVACDSKVDVLLDISVSLCCGWGSSWAWGLGWDWELRWVLSLGLAWDLC